MSRGERRLEFSLLKFMGAVLCVYETTRARLPREFIDSRATASFGRRSVLSSLLPLFWLTVAPCHAYGGRFVESNDVPSSGKEESFLVRTTRGNIYIYIFFHSFREIHRGGKNRIFFEIRSSSSRLLSTIFVALDNSREQWTMTMNFVMKLRMIKFRMQGVDVFLEHFQRIEK